MCLLYFSNSSPFEDFLGFIIFWFTFFSLFFRLKGRAFSVRGEDWREAGGDGQGGSLPRGHVHFTVIKGIF